MSILRDFTRRQGRSAEVGGILLGQVAEDNREILICRASIPSGRDRSSPSSFRRDRIAAQLVVDYEFHNSRGRNTYLGEWHTHDSAKASPSQRDIRMIEEQMRTNSVPAGLLILIVVAQDELYIALFDGNRLTSQILGGLSGAPLLNGL